jgi:hypothetical protein
VIIICIEANTKFILIYVLPQEVIQTLKIISIHIESNKICVGMVCTFIHGVTVGGWAENLPSKMCEENARNCTLGSQYRSTYS